MWYTTSKVLFKVNTVFLYHPVSTCFGRIDHLEAVMVKVIVGFVLMVVSVLGFIFAPVVAVGSALISHVGLWSGVAGIGSIIWGISNHPNTRWSMSEEMRKKMNEPLKPVKRH
jgi:hypothetical protein